MLGPVIFSRASLFFAAGIVLVLGWLGYFFYAEFAARPARPALAQTTEAENSASLEKRGLASSLGNTPAASPSRGSTNGWKPPEGDPVERYRALSGASAQERRELLAAFMALGHEKNPYMLIEALRDSSIELRVHAVESAASLTVGEATAVLRAAASNDHADVRDMAWSLAAPYPMESRVNIYAEALANGNEQALTEVLGEMGRTPERPLFEMMLLQAQNAEMPASRQARLLEELQTWLEPGGGEVPQFASPKQVLDWWQAQRENYDEYMLRVDQ